MTFNNDLIEHIPRLRRYARALTGDRVKADDLVQDTLERALRKQSLWRKGSNLRAWLFTLMHNVHANQWRGVNRPEMLQIDSHHSLLACNDTEGGAAFHDVLRGVALLPVEMREVILLVGLEQFTYAEAATVLSVPVGTIMSRLSRARERLRGWMSDKPVTTCDAAGERH